MTRERSSDAPHREMLDQSLETFKKLETDHAGT
jgi:hypothetical protein